MDPRAVTPTHRITVLSNGLLTTLQDGGRPGRRRLGIGRSGPADRTSARRANRLVGNPGAAALFEATLGRLEVTVDASTAIAVTGAPCELLVDGEPRRGPVLVLGPGQRLALGEPARGVRTYLAVAGGVVADDNWSEVLSSLSCDTLGGLGPRPVEPGDVFRAGPSSGRLPDVADAVPWDSDPALPLELTAGPHRSWLTDDAWAALVGGTWRVATADRVAARLDGAALRRRRDDEVATIGLVRGAIQVPRDGQPMVMAADHPTTGGYPVLAVTTELGADRVAQARPGDVVRFRLAPP